MYSVRDFGGMITDDLRRTAYLAAIRKYAPGSRVLDLGCGTGFFTLAALEMGAAHVTAIDLADGVRLLPRVIVENEYQDRCEVFHGDIADLNSEPFDLIISDLRGSLPLFRNQFAVISDVRQRLLKNDGVFLPTRDKIVCGLAEVNNWWEKTTAPYRLDEHNWGAYIQYELSQATRLDKLCEDSLISTTHVWDEIEYADFDGLSKKYRGKDFKLSATRSGRCHGLAVWFETELTDGIGYSTGPSSHLPTYGRQFFPFSKVASIRAGQTARVSLHANHIQDNWVWEWALKIESHSATHSTLDSLPLGASVEKNNVLERNKCQKIL